MNSVTISVVILWMGVGDLAARIISAIVSDRLPISKTLQYTLSNIFAAIISICLPFLSSHIGLTVALVALSVPRAILNILLPAISMEVSTAETCSETMALVYLTFGIETFITPYLTDFMYDITGSYDIAWFICAGLYMVAAVFFLLAIRRRNIGNIGYYRQEQSYNLMR
ncbi:monocarboxylate transporter 14-like isoform X1 [Antedon mediterranea]|uniref:monocarboxylate transporter 14-like isoform X1 n=1 Tax=Antedon mediterranea TaxID=105859 RepID=UPI003AF68D05